MVNNLKTIDLEANYNEVLEKIGLDPRIRADYLELDDYLKLFGALYA